MAVQIKTLKDLSTAARRLYERAETSVAQRNYGYAFEMLRGLLRQEPGFLDGRALLRKAQLDRFNGKVGLVAQGMAALKTFMPVTVKGPVLLQRGKFIDAMDVAEKALEFDPTASGSLSFLAKAAEGADLKLIAVAAYELAVKYHPKDIGLLQCLARVYEETGDFTRSLQTCQQLANLKPDSLEAQNATKRITALAAMKQGKWEGAGSDRKSVV